MSLEQLLAWIPPGSPDEALARQVNFEQLPAHIAIIMDGNGRWAAQRHLPRVEGHRAGIAPDQLDERRFSEFLYTAGQPDPDLLIRTSGEMRVSNFLLWQIAYSEIWVTETLWPDFRRRHLLEAVVAYQKRDRRYGGIK